MAYRNEKEKYYVNLWDKQSFVKRVEQRIVYITLVFTYPLLCECLHNNGSAMRVSPVGYYAKSLDEALQLAQISAEVTHNHPEGIIGAQAVAATIFLLRNGEWLEKGKKFLKDFCFYDLDEIKKDWNDICKFYTFDVTCQGSVPEAIYCAFRNMGVPNGYEFVIREAVSLGGDADTQAAIAGGIAASYSKVPDNILNECLDRLDPPLVDVIDKFNELVR